MSFGAILAVHKRRSITSHRIASHRIASHRITSHHIASHRIASHRIASHRIASHRIASHRMASFERDFATWRHRIALQTKRKRRCAAHPLYTATCPRLTPVATLLLARPTDPPPPKLHRRISPLGPRHCHADLVLRALRLCGKGGPGSHVSPIAWRVSQGRVVRDRGMGPRVAPRGRKKQGAVGGRCQSPQGTEYVLHLARGGATGGCGGSLSRPCARSHAVVRREWGWHGSFSTRTEHAPGMRRGRGGVEQRSTEESRAEESTAHAVA